jgi:hypothetical protein
MPIERIEIDDDLATQATGAIDVTVVFADGERRWCYFMTPEALSYCGDWINGTETRIHYGAAHMIVVAAPLTASLIEQALFHIQDEGDIMTATRRFPDASFTDADDD